MAGRLWETAETKALINLWAESAVQSELQSAKRNKDACKTNGRAWLSSHMVAMPC